MIKRSYFFISHLYLLLFQTISAGEIGTFSILPLVEAAIAPREMKIIQWEAIQLDQTKQTLIVRSRVAARIRAQ